MTVAPGPDKDPLQWSVGLSLSCPGWRVACPTSGEKPPEVTPTLPPNPSPAPPLPPSPAPVPSPEPINGPFSRCSVRPLDRPGHCLTTQVPNEGQGLSVEPCDGRTGQWFDYDGTELLGSDSRQCLDIVGGLSGTRLGVWECNGGLNQDFYASSGRQFLAADGRCITATTEADPITGSEQWSLGLATSCNGWGLVCPTSGPPDPTPTLQADDGAFTGCQLLPLDRPDQCLTSEVLPPLFPFPPSPP